MFFPIISLWQIMKHPGCGKPMADNEAPGMWPIWTPGSRLAGLIKGLTKNIASHKI